MTWSDLTPEQQGKRREEIWRVLQREGERTCNSLMHRLALDYSTVASALSAMVESGAVNSRADSGLTFYAAASRK